MGKTLDEYLGRDLELITGNKLPNRRKNFLNFNVFGLRKFFPHLFAS